MVVTRCSLQHRFDNNNNFSSKIPPMFHVFPTCLWDITCFLPACETSLWDITCFYLPVRRFPACFLPACATSRVSTCLWDVMCFLPACKTSRVSCLLVRRHAFLAYLVGLSLRVCSSKELDQKATFFGKQRVKCREQVDGIWCLTPS